MSNPRFLGHLKTRHYQLLVALDDCRNVGKVAALSNVSQPAVSKILAELEAGFGVKLFERLPKGLHPTIYGQCLIRHARNALATLSHVTDELHGLLSGDRERISVGTSPHATIGVVPESLALLKQKFPGTTVVVREGATEAHLTDLWLGKIDIFIGRIPLDCPAELSVKVLSSEPMLLVVGTRHPLARRKRIQWMHLQGYPWVLPPIGTPLREPLDRALQEHGLPMPRDRIETLSVHTIQAYLNRTDALAILAPQVSHYFEKLGLIKVLKLQLPHVARSSGMVWYQKRASATLRAFMECVEASYSKLAVA
ncbi:LysR family transcriptional regulator [Pigmentiphaga soli]|uniref:LysR family transcriptional regulator n=1 Tax=Pigmentiphaga soli TaxID=1007095 RepID=A0ABP8H385_9BURK